MFLNPLVLSFLVPAIAVLCLGGIKSLVEGQSSWARFYLGLELTLLALGNGLTNVVDRLREWDGNSARALVNEVENSISFTVVAAVGMLIVMLIHQRFANQEKAGPVPERWVARGFWLGFFCNAVGGVLIWMYVYFRLEGKL
jgi:hypothetical protein